MAGLKRNNLEKYYTKKNICEQYIKQFTQIVKPSLTDTILEPSAGNGSFSLILQDIFPNVLCYDIEPEHDTIIKQDFLSLDTSSVNKPIHVIGNPPFGRQSSLAKKFIQKSCEFAISISFILPKSFKKDSFQKIFNSKFHLIFSEDVPVNSFLLNNHSHNVPCVFQIWIRKELDRTTLSIQNPTYYSFVKKSEQHDFSIRRVGGTAGKLDRNTKNKSIQSHYFIKLHHNIPDFEETYNQIVKFLHDNTVGPKSISKQELIRQLNDLYIFI